MGPSGQAASSHPCPGRRQAQPLPPVHPRPKADRPQATAPASHSQAPADPGQAALDAQTIQHLHSSLRALPRPQLESLTQAFRKRFQVPEEAVTIADRINQRCHHDWIEAYLVQQQVAA